MSSPPLRVQIATYNFGAASGLRKAGDDLAGWLRPTLDKKAGEEPADIIAVGFQETLPLHYALLGWSQYAVDAHDAAIAACIGSGQGYTLVSKTIHGGMAVLVYTRDETVTSRVNDVRVAAVGCGTLYMGNKGAVGVRLVLGAAKSKYEDDDDLSDETYTFVCTHMAAHEHKVKRRNADWRSIVQRLVFTPDSMSRSKHFAPGKPRNPFHREGRRVDQMQIWDTSYLFFFGDMNYRISKTTPRTLKPQVVVHKIHNDLEALLPHDQLRQEQKAGRTLHHLVEAPITFKPTYKRIVGSVSEYKAKKRTPSWTDRVLYASWDQGRDEKRAHSPAVILYTAVEEIVISDHKPVTAVIDLPRVSSRIERPLRLASPVPFPLDRAWRSKRRLGYFADRVVGTAWCLIVLLGAGSTKRGVSVALLLLLSYVYMKLQ